LGAQRSAAILFKQAVVMHVNGHIDGHHTSKLGTKRIGTGFVLLVAPPKLNLCYEGFVYTQCINLIIFPEAIATTDSLM
jgi:hypothetical protein